jgi:hypothetical protein
MLASDSLNNINAVKRLLLVYLQCTVILVIEFTTITLLGRYEHINSPLLVSRLPLDALHTPTIPSSINSASDPCPPTQLLHFVAVSSCGNTVDAEPAADI